MNYKTIWNSIIAFGGTTLSSYKNLLKESKKNINVLKSKYNITDFNELIDSIEKHIES